MSQHFIFERERRFPEQLPDCERVLDACERWGFGNIMQLVSEAWRAKDSFGGFAVGVCFSMLEKRGVETSLDLMDRYDAAEAELAEARELLAASTAFVFGGYLAFRILASPEDRWRVVGPSGADVPRGLNMPFDLTRTDAICLARELAAKAKEEAER